MRTSRKGTKGFPVKLTALSPSGKYAVQFNQFTGWVTLQAKVYGMPDTFNGTQVWVPKRAKKAGHPVVKYRIVPIEEADAKD